jgi:hypothetical protein
VADASVPGSQLADTPRIVLFAHTIFHNRNRTYNPQQGRFLQLDMNASGVALMEAAAFNGRGMGALAVAFDMQTRYGDGANLYQYLGSNPWQRFDPMGLFFGDAMSAGVDGYGANRGIADPFDMVDEYIAEDYGAKAAWLGNIMKNTAAGLDVLWTGVQLMPGIGQGAALYRIANGNANFWDYVSVVPVAGPAARLVAKMTMSFATTTRKVTRTISLPVIQALCFTAGTLVTQADGSKIEIERLRVGQSVLSWHDQEAIATFESWLSEIDAVVAFSKIEDATWRSVELEYTHDSGDTTNITLLRPTAWLDAIGAEPGSSIWLEMPELHIHGDARVVCVGPIPEIYKVDDREISPDVYERTITGTFVTTGARVHDLWIEGEMKAIGVTTSHPFFSEDRASWISASELRPGERLRALKGIVRVQEVKSRLGRETVYNIEVRDSHTYYVGDNVSILSHNACIPDFGDKMKYLFGDATGRVHNIERSTDMARQLNRIGIQGTESGKRAVMDHLTVVLNNPSSIVSQIGNNHKRESLLMGPAGGVKLISHWEGSKLITVIIQGG